MKQRAFTLIELLVVIAIIAILAAMLFPVYSQAKVAALKSAGLQQMRQLAIGVMMYASDHDDALVPSTNYDAPLDHPSRIWTNGLMPYVKSKDIFIAPGANGSEFAVGWAMRDRQSVGYSDITAFATLIGNTADRICNDGEVRFGCSAFWSVANLTQMEDVSRVGLFANTAYGLGGKYRGFVFGADNGTVYRADYTAFTSLEQAVPLASDRDMVAEMGGPPLNLSPSELKPILARYGKTGNDQGSTPVIFGDGHARSYTAASIKSGASRILWRFR